MEGEEDRTREELKKCEQCSGTVSCYNQLMMYPLIPLEKAVEEAVRNCELVKRREHEEEDEVTLEELEKQRVEALNLVEKERKIVEQESAVYESIADKISKRHKSHHYTDAFIFSELNTADQDTHLEAAISILDTMEGVAS